MTRQRKLSRARRRVPGFYKDTSFAHASIPARRRHAQRLCGLPGIPQSMRPKDRGPDSAVAEARFCGTQQERRIARPEALRESSYQGTALERENAFCHRLCDTLALFEAQFCSCTKRAAAPGLSMPFEKNCGSRRTRRPNNYLTFPAQPQPLRASPQPVRVSAPQRSSGIMQHGIPLCGQERAQSEEQTDELHDEQSTRRIQGSVQFLFLPHLQKLKQAIVFFSSFFPHLFGR